MRSPSLIDMLSSAGSDSDNGQQGQAAGSGVQQQLPPQQPQPEPAQQLQQQHILQAQVAGAPGVQQGPGPVMQLGRFEFEFGPVGEDGLAGGICSAQLPPILRPLILQSSLNDHKIARVETLAVCMVCGRFGQTTSGLLNRPCPKFTSRTGLRNLMKLACGEYPHSGGGLIGILA